VDLFGRKMDREGIRTTGTIERVVVTERGSGGGGHLERSEETATVVYLSVRFTDQEGVVHTQEVKTTFRSEHIPPPSGEIELGYMPKDPTNLHTYGTGPVDPSIPRGWGAGIFEVEDLGGHHTKSLFGGHGLDDQRELFRTGQRAQATVVSVTCLSPHRERRSTREYSLTLRAGGQEIEARAWAPFRCVPQPGDQIEIAVSADGSDVALDTDERYDGPPGQALVFTTPAPAAGEVSAEDAAQPGAASAPAGENPAVVRLLAQLAAMKQARARLRHYEKTVRALLDGQRGAGIIDDARHDQLLQEALSD
jgi:hypothetical protein